MKEGKTMERIQSKEALLKLRDTFKENLRVREQGEQIEKLITIKVFMGSSGYKSGAKEILNHFYERAKERKIEDLVVLQADSSGLIAFEPMIGVTLPGKKTVLFGKVDLKKADEIIDEYILKGKQIDGILSLTSSVAPDRL